MVDKFIKRRIWLTTLFYLREPFVSIKDSKESFIKPKTWMWINLFLSMLFLFYFRKNVYATIFFVLTAIFHYWHKIHHNYHKGWVRQKEKEILIKENQLSQKQETTKF